MRPHYSRSSRENATPSSGISLFGQAIIQIIIIIIIIMEFIQRLYIAVLSALQCIKGHKNIINHKLTQNTTVHILERKEKNKNKTKSKTKTNMTKLNVIHLFKKKRFQLRFKKINIRTSSNFKGELVPSRGTATKNARWP